MKPSSIISKTQFFFFFALGLIFTLTFSSIVCAENQVLRKAYLEKKTDNTVSTSVSQKAIGPASAKGAAIGQDSGEQSFGTGFDTNQSASWSSWKPVSESAFPMTNQEPESILPPNLRHKIIPAVPAYKFSANTDPDILAFD